MGGTEIENLNRPNAMDLKKLAPWNWFKSEEADRGNSRELAVRPGEFDHPFSRLHREVDRLFDAFPVSIWQGFEPSGAAGKLLTETLLMRPSVDISESGKKYTIKVEVPGVEKEDVHVDVQDDVLVIRGEKKQEHEEKGEHFHRIERSYGSFRRVLNLPPDADPDEVRAKFRNGVLTLTVAKSGEKTVSGRTIEIG
jgi:HSP20 family protein